MFLAHTLNCIRERTRECKYTTTGWTVIKNTKQTSVITYSSVLINTGSFTIDSIRNINVLLVVVFKFFDKNIPQLLQFIWMCCVLVCCCSTCVVIYSALAFVSVCVWVDAVKLHTGTSTVKKFTRYNQRFMLTKKTSKNISN